MYLGAESAAILDCLAEKLLAQFRRELSENWSKLRKMEAKKLAEEL